MFPAELTVTARPVELTLFVLTSVDLIFLRSAYLLLAALPAIASYTAEKYRPS